MMACFASTVPENRDDEQTSSNNLGSVVSSKENAWRESEAKKKANIEHQRASLGGSDGKKQLPTMVLSFSRKIFSFSYFF